MKKSELMKVSENVRAAIEYVRKALEKLEILEWVYELGAEKDDIQALKIEQELMIRNPVVDKLEESESRLRDFLEFLHELERRVK
jgi:hypothetical protein